MNPAMASGYLVVSAVSAFAAETILLQSHEHLPQMVAGQLNHTLPLLTVEPVDSLETSEFRCREEASMVPENASVEALDVSFVPEPTSLGQVRSKSNHDRYFFAAL